MTAVEVAEQIEWARRVYDQHIGAERTLIELLAQALERTSRELLKTMTK